MPSANEMMFALGIYGAVCVSAVGAVSAGVYGGYNYFVGKNVLHTFPRDKKIAADYVKPSDIEIKLEDLNRNGDNETIFAFKNKNYLLKLDNEGNPRIVKYSLSPTEISEYSDKK